MSNSEENELTEALLDLKEAYLISVSKRLISNRIPESEILLLARTLPHNKSSGNLSAPTSFTTYGAR